MSCLASFQYKHAATLVEMLEGKKNFCQVCTSVLTCLVIKLALGVCANLNQDFFNGIHYSRCKQKEVFF